MGRPELALTGLPGLAGIVMISVFSPELRRWCADRLGMEFDGGDHYYQFNLEKALEDGRIDAETIARLSVPESVHKNIARSVRAKGFKDETQMEERTPYSVLSGGSHSNPQAQREERKYKDVRYPAKHVKTGVPMFHKGEQVTKLSERELAKVGTYYKWVAKRQGLPVVMTEHEGGLLEDMFEKDVWTGDFGDQHFDQISGTRVKALLSDNTSGAVQMNPIWFDANFITSPLLSGELYPYVEVVDMSRGNTVQGGRIQTPTVVWNVADGTSISLQNTTNFVTAMNTNIFDVAVGIEMGRDLLSDTPLDLGATIQALIDERYTAEMDKVVAVGDGTNQPTGLANTTGPTSVLATFPNNGPITADDAERLIFGVAKQYRLPAWQPCFVSNDQVYRRFRSIPLGTDNAGRLFGNEIKDYSLFGYDYRISNDMADNQLLFCCTRKYRMYRRSGTEIRWSQEGQTLMSKNTALLIVRARYGGRMTDPAALAVMSNLGTAG